MSDRKYRHRGYADTERSQPPEKKRERAPAPARDRHEKPRGRGLGAPTESVFACARCGGAAQIGAAAELDARCTSCGADLHVCKNCVAFDPGARFECRREIPERISPKDGANRCQLFEPRTRQEFAAEKPQAGDPRAAFDALFKL